MANWTECASDLQPVFIVRATPCSRHRLSVASCPASPRQLLRGRPKCQASKFAEQVLRDDDRVQIADEVILYQHDGVRLVPIVAVDESS